MGTRATYQFLGQYSDAANALVIYSHWDNYPSGAAANLLSAACEYAKGGRFEPRKYRLNTIEFIRAVPGAEITESHESHGDTEYRYICSGRTVSAYKAVYNEGSNDTVFELFFEGDLQTFLIEYGDDDLLALVKDKTVDEICAELDASLKKIHVVPRNYENISC